MPSTLDAFPPLSALPARLRARVRGLADVRHLASGETLFEQDSAPGSIYAVLAGRLAMRRLGREGRWRTVCLATPGSLCCCVSALDGGPCPASAVAVTDTVVVGIPCPVFSRLLHTQPAFSKAVLGRIGQQLRRFQCDGPATEDAGARIAAKIVAAVGQFGSEVPLTRREVAELAGTSVETAIRQTRRFEDAGWLTLRRGRIQVSDLAALRRAAGLEGPGPRASDPS